MESRWGVGGWVEPGGGRHVGGEGIGEERLVGCGQCVCTLFVWLGIVQ